MKRTILLLLVGAATGSVAVTANAAAPASSTNAATHSASATPISASEVAAVTAPLNPLTGQPISAETLTRILKVKTLQADIAGQDLRRVRAERQMNGPLPGSAGPVPPPVAPAVKDKSKGKPYGKQGKPTVARAHSLVPLAAVSPVAGILTEHGVRYALLQIHGQGKMARVGDTFMGHHVGAITATTVTLDGLRFRPDQAVSTIADVEQPLSAATAATAGATAGGPHPIYPPLRGPLPQLSTVLNR
ncbi:hypothetical protein [Pandoraea sp.]|uniref:hypothetical protein n=1 Tax=Pandoraea sp. TaxID=1883445 RepID=UPI001205D825|nr:hypothetical protein [Pandoraea sp.]TAL56924.1 MAG: hypothetical protein EPN80_01875 [Pandoraea sp.]TAM17718.1 MAG: hypothetical protein EPN65_09875 [Pandoraea sp.]